MFESELGYRMGLGGVNQEEKIWGMAGEKRMTEKGESCIRRV